MTESRCFHYFGLSEKLGERDGGTFLRCQGCNGTRHLDHLFVEYRDSDGKLSLSVTRGYVELDRCDGTCASQSSEGFLYDPKMAPYPFPC